MNQLTNLMLETPSVYIPMDRRHALVQGISLADQTKGAALFADISGFTQLTEKLAKQLGPQRGAEELTIYLNQVYDTLISELHAYQGSVIGFSGDAITCWFDADDGRFALLSAWNMQKAMARFEAIQTPSRDTVNLTMKTAVTTGNARRFIVGDPEIQVFDVLAGTIMDCLAEAEHFAQKGEVILDQETIETLGKNVEIKIWHYSESMCQKFGVVENINYFIPPDSWPNIPVGTFKLDQIKPWVIPSIFNRMHEGKGEFLSELRPATALFLKFTGINYDSDQEACHKLDQFIRAVQQTISPYDGTLIQLTIGDKGSYLYVAFGAPNAYEDQEERAARSALDLIALEKEFNYLSAFQVGLSQGRMRTGSYGSHQMRTYGVLGEETNMAARLMQNATPGQILVNQETCSRIIDEFDVEILTPIYVKGRSSPLAVVRLLGPKSKVSSTGYEAVNRKPLIGRSKEIDQINSIIASVIGGKGQVISISGDAGVGKSRVVAEIIGTTILKDFKIYRGECQSFGTNTAYLVWRNILRDLFELNLGDQIDQIIESLESQLVVIDPILIKRIPLLGTVLNLNIPENDLTLGLDPKIRKSALEALLVDVLLAKAAINPIAIILEDCHWIDSLSNDLLEQIGKSLLNSRIILVTAFRPPNVRHPREPKIKSLQNVESFVLQNLTLEESALLVDHNLGEIAIKDEDVIEQFYKVVYERTEGNPFYIEEVLSYIKGCCIDAIDSQTLTDLELPTSLHSLILSRIDRLTESERVTLKVASVIGRLFEAAILWGSYPELGEKTEVLDDLGGLQTHELIIVESELELIYLFKNLVTQEVTYDSIPFHLRARLHNLIAQYIENEKSGEIDRHIDFLAFHYGRSENASKKREYLIKAGDAARKRYANESAIDYYSRVLSILEENEIVEIELKLGNVLELTGQWQTALEHYQNAYNLSNILDDPLARARCQVSLGELFRKKGHYEESLIWLEKAQLEFSAIKDNAGISQTLHYLGNLKAQQGKKEDAKNHYLESLRLRREMDDKPQVANLLSNLAILARWDAEYQVAKELGEESLAIRREVGDRWAIAVSLNNLGELASDLGNYDQARILSEEAVKINKEIGSKYYYANSLNTLANVLRTQSDYDNAYKFYLQSLRINSELGDGWQIATLLEDMGVLAAMEGRAERAEVLVGAAQTIREEIGASMPEPERKKLEAILKDSRRLINTQQQKLAFDQGLAMTIDEAIKFAQEI